MIETIGKFFYSYQIRNKLMVLTYKKAGVDISKIKQSQKAIGKLICINSQTTEKRPR